MKTTLETAIKCSSGCQSVFSPSVLNTESNGSVFIDGVSSGFWRGPNSDVAIKVMFHCIW